MTIEEFKAILNNKNMQSKETNIKVYRNGTSKITLKEFYDQFLEFVKQQKKFNERQEQFNAYVLDQFKKHGWSK